MPGGARPQLPGPPRPQQVVDLSGPTARGSTSEPRTCVLPPQGHSSHPHTPHNTPRHLWGQKGPATFSCLTSQTTSLSSTRKARDKDLRQLPEAAGKLERGFHANSPQKAKSFRYEELFSNLSTLGGAASAVSELRVWPSARSLGEPAPGASIPQPPPPSVKSRVRVS